MRFPHLQGYERFQEPLIKMVAEGRLPSALSLNGAAGSPLLPYALALIAYLHCVSPRPKGACEQCHSCNQMKNLSHPDLHFLFPLASTSLSNSKLLTVADLLPFWRTFVTQTPNGGLQQWLTHLKSQSKKPQISKDEVHKLQVILSKTAFSSKLRSVILWLPEQLHPAASNALLKIVEEPPSHVHLVFLSHRPDQMLPTLRSRTAAFSLPAPAAQNPLEGNHFLTFASWLRALYRKQLATLVQIAEEFHRQAPPTQKGWILYGLALLRAALWSSAGTPKAQPNEEVATFTDRVGSHLSLRQMAGLINGLEALHKHLERHAHPKLALLVSSLKMMPLFNLGN